MYNLQLNWLLYRNSAIYVNMYNISEAKRVFFIESNIFKREWCRDWNHTHRESVNLISMWALPYTVLVLSSTYRVWPPDNYYGAPDMNSLRSIIIGSSSTSMQQPHTQIRPGILFISHIHRIIRYYRALYLPSRVHIAFSLN